MKKYAITAVASTGAFGRERVYYISVDGALKFPENVREEDLYDTQEEAHKTAVKYGEILGKTTQVVELQHEDPVL
jgi:hypothetical protein